MKFHTFIFHIMQKIQEDMENQIKISIRDVTKNNSIVLTGLTFTQENINISPTIYLEEFYKDYEEGKSIERIVEEIKEIYYNSKLEGNLNMDFFTDYQKAKKNIVYKLINYDKNKELLEEVPHRKYLDLAIVYYYLVDMKEFTNATILIHNKHMEKWETDENELYALAVKNTPKLLPVQFCGMMEVLKELSQDEIFLSVKADEIRCTKEEEELRLLLELHIRKDETGMYVLSNTSRLFGAAALLYPDMAEECARQLNADYYILPSSVHEVILLPDEGQVTKEKLKQMVCEVNETQVEPEEVLSDFVYYFSRKTGEITRL